MIHCILLIAFLATFIDGMRLEGSGTTTTEFEVDEIQTDESNANCVFVETITHRFRLFSVDNEKYLVLNVEELQRKGPSHFQTAKQLAKDAKQFAKDHPYKATAIGLPLAIAGVGASATAAGFGAAGIVGGSIAASIQSGMGSVAGGSLFATLQSLGATGMFATMTTGGLGASAAAVAASSMSGSSKEKNHGDWESSNVNEACESSFQEKNEGDHASSNRNEVGDLSKHDSGDIVEVQKFIGLKATIIGLRKLQIFHED